MKDATTEHLAWVRESVRRALDRADDRAGGLLATDPGEAITARAAAAQALALVSIAESLHLAVTVYGQRTQLERQLADLLAQVQAQAQTQAARATTPSKETT